MKFRQSCLPNNIFEGISALSSRGVKVNPSRTGGGNASKNVGRQAGLPTRNVGNFERQAGLPTFYVDDPACLPTFYVGNHACLPTFLEAFPPPVREGLSPSFLSNTLFSRVPTFVALLHTKKVNIKRDKNGVDSPHCQWAGYPDSWWLCRGWRLSAPPSWAPLPSGPFWGRGSTRSTVATSLPPAPDSSSLTILGEGEKDGIWFDLFKLQLQ